VLQYLGEDADREGLQDTPKRVIAAMEFWTKGYEEKPEDHLRVFEDGGEDYNEMLVETNIPLYSLCEHHLAPFFGVAHVAYVPGKHIVGLSKIVKMVEVYARRLQVQERLTTQIAEAINKVLKPKGVAVMLQCQHLCMASRGVQKAGVMTTTVALRGVFKDFPETREEFYHVVRLNQK
jgi:GTP cyclohydrolase I